MRTTLLCMPPRNPVNPCYCFNKCLLSNERLIISHAHNMRRRGERGTLSRVGGWQVHIPAILCPHPLTCMYVASYLISWCVCRMTISIIGSCGETPFRCKQTWGCETMSCLPQEVIHFMSTIFIFIKTNENLLSCLNMQDHQYHHYS